MTNKEKHKRVEILLPLTLKADQDLNCFGLVAGT